VTGYYVHAADGDIGHIEDLLVDDGLSAVRAVVVDTRNWLPGRKVMVRIERFREVDWFDRHITTDLTRGEVEASPGYEPDAAGRVRAPAST
jgi:hypothetical protein